ncbi:Trm112 family protein [Sphingobium bisphenolivorans]|uniref:Trm112 family protein n=1 Tax=Sphingobium bisphenolivorans TaxID=1335760 RepID=UPI00039AB40E|nr:Trm112 family protein [Sphingobium bisphenolivorans]
MTSRIDPVLLAKLVCPVTRTPLRWDDQRGELVSEAAGLAFPVRDGVPVMVVREARVISSE